MSSLYRREDEAVLTLNGALIGSPAYMAPEQVESDMEHIGPQTDVYALGLILYEMLCGRRPFEGTTLKVLHDHAWSEPPRPTSIREDISPELETICRQAMAKKPAHRFESAAELAAALERFLDAGAARGSVTKSVLMRVVAASLLLACAAKRTTCE